jgi:hypothetical protein
MASHHATATERDTIMTSALTSLASVQTYVSAQQILLPAELKRDIESVLPAGFRARGEARINPGA